MRNRLFIAAALVAASLGFGASAATAHDTTDDPYCGNATTGIDGAGVWVNGVTGPSKCFSDTFDGAKPHQHCDVYVVAVAYRCV